MRSTTTGTHIILVFIWCFVHTCGGLKPLWLQSAQHDDSNDEEKKEPHDVNVNGKGPLLVTGKRLARFVMPPSDKRPIPITLGPIKKLDSPSEDIDGLSPVPIPPPMTPGPIQVLDSPTEDLDSPIEDLDVPMPSVRIRSIPKPPTDTRPTPISLGPIGDLDSLIEDLDGYSDYVYDPNLPEPRDIREFLKKLASEADKIDWTDIHDTLWKNPSEPEKPEVPPPPPLPPLPDYNEEEGF